MPKLENWIYSKKPHGEWGFLSSTRAPGGTSATDTTLVDADRLVVNDNGTMVQVDLSDVKTYLNSAGYVTDDPTALAIALG